jgi:Ketopantoate hydroxymethyltransferase
VAGLAWSGAGPHCDGQVLVSYDVLGLFDAFVPSFVRQYARLGEFILSAAKDFASDVRQGAYPPVAAAQGSAEPIPVSTGALAIAGPDKMPQKSDCCDENYLN